MKTLKTVALALTVAISGAASAKGLLDCPKTKTIEQCDAIMKEPGYKDKVSARYGRMIDSKPTVFVDGAEFMTDAEFEVAFNERVKSETSRLAKEEAEEAARDWERRKETILYTTLGIGLAGAVWVGEHAVFLMGLGAFVWAVRRFNSPLTFRRAAIRGRLTKRPASIRRPTMKPLIVIALAGVALAGCARRDPPVVSAPAYAPGSRGS